MAKYHESRNEVCLLGLYSKKILLFEVSQNFLHYMHGKDQRYLQENKIGFSHMFSKWRAQIRKAQIIKKVSSLSLHNVGNIKMIELIEFSRKTLTFEFKVEDKM